MHTPYSTGHSRSSSPRVPCWTHSPGPLWSLTLLSIAGSLRLSPLRYQQPYPSYVLGRGNAHDTQQERHIAWFGHWRRGSGEHILIRPLTIPVIGRRSGTFAVVLKARLTLGVKDVHKFATNKHQHELGGLEPPLGPFLRGGSGPRRWCHARHRSMARRGRVALHSLQEKPGATPRAGRLVPCQDPCALCQ